ncbi:MAG: hypothetical protein VXW24_04310 [Bacteroidota bacterium]|nr:hypothetical protein [Bacteroidota bacterium]
MPVKIREKAVRPERAKAEPRKPIFERYIKNALQRMESEELDANGLISGSLPAARGRFVEGQGREKAVAAYNWKVVGYHDKVKERVPGKNEIVAVHIKAGSRMVALLEDPETGKIKKSIEIPSENVVPVLEDIKKFLETLDKNSEDGKIFHEQAKLTATPRFKKGEEKPYDYCEKTDEWIIHDNKTAQKAWLDANK